MSNEVQALRRETDLTNSVKVIGYLKAKSITEGLDKNKKPFIKGVLTVQTKKNQNVDVDFYFGKFKTDGGVSKLFEEAQKLKEYISIVDLIEKKTVANEEEAQVLCDIVDINGSINPNEYINDEEVLVSRPKINGTFFHRVERAKANVDKFGAFFDVEVYFTSIKPEYKNKLETGRAVVEAVVPTSVEYAKVGAMSFIVAEEQNASNYLLNNYIKDASGRVWGEFVITEKEEAVSGFGVQNQVSSGGVEYQWIIQGGEPKQYSEGSKKDFDRKAIEKALEQRFVEAEQAKANKKSKAKPGNHPAGFNNISQQTQAQIEARFSDDDF